MKLIGDGWEWSGLGSNATVLTEIQFLVDFLNEYIYF